MGKSNFLAALISLFIHSSLIFILLLKKEVSPPKSNSPISTVSLSPKKQQPLNLSKKSKTSDSQKIDLDSLKALSIKIPEYSLLNDNSEASNYKAMEGDVFATMNQMSLSEYSSNHLFFEVLRLRLDQYIQYPQELVEHNIQGKLKVSLLVSPKGELLKIINASAKHPILKTFTIIGIFKALKNKLPKKYWYTKNRNLTLEFYFDFKIFTFGNQQSRSESRFFKNRFDFLRVQNGPDIIEEFVIQNARYIPPILPLPGGFIISFTQAYNFLKAWSEMDPKMRKRQRLEMTKEKLDLMLKKMDAPTKKTSVI